MDQKKLKTWFKAQGLTMRDVAHATGYAYTHLVEMVNGTAPLSDSARYRIATTYPETAIFLLPASVLSEIVSAMSATG